MNALPCHTSHARRKPNNSVLRADDEIDRELDEFVYGQASTVHYGISELSTWIGKGYH